MPEGDSRGYRAYIALKDAIEREESAPAPLPGDLADNVIANLNAAGHLFARSDERLIHAAVAKVMKAPTPRSELAKGMRNDLAKAKAQDILQEAPAPRSPEDYSLTRTSTEAPAPIMQCAAISKTGQQCQMVHGHRWQHYAVDHDGNVHMDWLNEGAPAPRSVTRWHLNDGQMERHPKGQWVEYIAYLAMAQRSVPAPRSPDDVCEHGTPRKLYCVDCDEAPQRAVVDALKSKEAPAPRKDDLEAIERVREQLANSHVLRS